MSKRSFDDALSPSGAQPEHIDNAPSNGLLPINDLLSPSHDLQQTSGPAKKPRNFIATVVRVTLPRALAPPCPVNPV
jgi:hypothetical protein